MAMAGFSAMWPSRNLRACVCLDQVVMQIIQICIFFHHSSNLRIPMSHGPVFVGWSDNLQEGKIENKANLRFKGLENFGIAGDPINFDDTRLVDDELRPGFAEHRFVSPDKPAYIFGCSLVAKINGVSGRVNLRSV